MDDDLIRRALGSRHEPDPAAALLERAVAAGTSRRRRRLGGLAAAAAVAMVVTGAVSATRGDGQQIVGVSPTTDVDVTPAVTSVPVPLPTAGSVPPTDATTVVPVVPVTSPPVETLPPVVPGGTSAPFVEPPALPCAPAPELTADQLVLSVVGPAPEPWDGVVAQRYAGVRAAGIELWGPDGRAATLTDTVPDDPDEWYCPTGLLPLGYDGRALWAAESGLSDCRCPDAPLRSRLFRADLADGSIVEAWSSDGTDQVLGVLPGIDASVSVLSGPRFGAAGDLVFRPSPDHTWIGERRWVLDGPLVDARLVGAGIDPLVRPFVVYITGGRFLAPTTLHVIVLGQRDQELTVDLTGRLIDPAILGVSEDGTRVLLQEEWEGLGSVHLVGLAAGDVVYVGSGGCWTSTGLLARSTWTYDSERVFGDPGTVELIQPWDLAVVADLGLDTYGGALACLGGERVALTMYDGVPHDPATGTQSSVVPGSERLVIAEEGALRELVRDPDLRPVGRNADD